MARKNQEKNQPKIKIKNKYRKYLLTIILLVLGLSVFYLPLGQEIPFKIIDEYCCNGEGWECIFKHLYIICGVGIIISLITFWLLTGRIPKIR